MGGDPRAAMMAAIQGGGLGGPSSMPGMPGGRDPYGMIGQGGMAEGMGGMMDLRIGGGIGGGMGGDDFYGMMQGQGGMAGGMGVTGDFDMSMGVVMGGERCCRLYRRC